MRHPTQGLEAARSLMKLAGPYASQVASMFAENCRCTNDLSGLQFWTKVLDMFADLEAEKGVSSPPSRPQQHNRKMFHPPYEVAALSMK